MMRATLLAILLVAPVAGAAEAPASLAPTAPTMMPAAPVPPPVPPAGAALPAMSFESSLISDELLQALKATAPLSRMDKELVGSPLRLVVSHTMRPTAGGNAVGFLSAILSGSTLGLLPVVSNDRLVVRYDVMLNGKSITSYSFERTATRAQNIWVAGHDGYGELGKSGADWVKSTAAEVAAKLAVDPALLAVRDEVAFYFPADASRPASVSNTPSAEPWETR